MKRRLDALLEGAALPAEAAALERHVAACDVCMRYIQSTRWVQATLTQARPEFVPPDRAASRQMFLNALEASGALNPRREVLRQGMALASACCALAAMGLAAHTLLSRSHNLTGAGNAARQVSIANSIDQLVESVRATTVSRSSANHGGRKAKIVHALRHWHHHRPSQAYLAEACRLLQDSGADTPASRPASVTPHLSVTVSCEAPRLEVAVSNEPASAPGYARATLAQNEPDGAVTYTACTVSLTSSDTGATEVKHEYIDGAATLHSLTEQYAYHDDILRGALQ